MNTRISINLDSISIDLEALADINRALDLSIDEWVNILREKKFLSVVLGDCLYEEYSRKFSTIEEMHSILDEIKSYGDQVESFGCFYGWKKVDFKVKKPDPESEQVRSRIQFELNAKKKRILDMIDDEDIPGAVRAAWDLLWKNVGSGKPLLLTMKIDKVKNGEAQ